jgi:hypothetical protein
MNYFVQVSTDYIATGHTTAERNIELTTTFVVTDGSNAVRYGVVRRTCKFLLLYFLSEFLFYFYFTSKCNI